MSRRPPTAPVAPVRSHGLALVALGVVGAAAAVPLAMNPWGYNPFGPVKALVLAACALSVAVGLAVDRDLLRGLTTRLRESRVVWSAGVLWVVIALSTVLSVDAPRSIIGSYPEYQGVLAWLAVTVIACGAASLPWPDSWRWAARAVSLSVIVIGGYAFVQALGADPVAVNVGSAADRVRATLGNSSNAGVYLLFATPFLIERLRRDGSRAWRAVAGLGAASAIVMIVFTASRGAWVGLVVAAAVWLGVEAVRWERSRRRMVFAAALGVAVLLAVAVLAIPRLGKRVAPASGGTIEWRLVVWQATARIVADRPLLGWGPNSFRYVYPSFRPRSVAANSNLGSTAGDPHDVVMSAAVSLGIPGALGLLALIATAGVACAGLLRSRRDDDLMPVAITTALSGGLAALMFHYATLDTMPVMAVLLGLLVAARVRPRGPLVPSPDRWTRAVAAGMCGVLAIVLVAASGLVAADSVMRAALAPAAGGSTWPATDARLHSAEVLAPWEPTFTWAIGKAAIVAVSDTGDPRAYADGQAALSSARRSLPLDNGVVFDQAYLMARFGIATRDVGPIREARATFGTLTGKDPNNPQYWKARGLASASLGLFAEAEEDLRTAISLAPGKSEYATALRQVQSAARSGR